MRIVNLLFVALLTPFWLLAQPALEGGLFIGASNYQGDFTLNSSPELSENHLALGLVARHPLSRTHALRANLAYGKLTGNDANFNIRERRGSTFQTTLIELSVVGEWEPFGRNRVNQELDFAQRLSPYFFAGPGLAFINPEPLFGEVDDAKAIEDLNADYSKVQFVLPLGLGLRAGINKAMSASLELGMRKTFTDYLDGMSQAGMPGNSDWYVFGGLMVLYRIW